MKKIFYIIIAILVVLILLKGCQYEMERKQLIAQLSQYQLSQKQFEVQRLGDSTTIATQDQTIMSQKDALKLGLIQMEKDMKELQSQVKQRSETRIIEKQVPFIPDGYADTIGLVRNEKGEVIRKDSIAVPTRFQLNEKWFGIDGYVNKDGLKLDSIKIPNKTTISVGYKKSGFLNLGKDPVVRVKNENPYVNVTGLDNVVIKKKHPFYKSPLFTIGVGVVLGTYLKK